MREIVPSGWGGERDALSTFYPCRTPMQCLAFLSAWWIAYHGGGNSTGRNPISCRLRFLGAKSLNSLTTYLHEDTALTYPSLQFKHPKTLKDKKQCLRPITLPHTVPPLPSLRRPHPKREAILRGPEADRGPDMHPLLSALFSLSLSLSLPSVSRAYNDRHPRAETIPLVGDPETRQGGPGMKEERTT